MVPLPNHHSEDIVRSAVPTINGLIQSNWFEQKSMAETIVSTMNRSPARWFSTRDFFHHIPLFTWVFHPCYHQSGAGIFTSALKFPWHQFQGAAGRWSRTSHQFPIGWRGPSPSSDAPGGWRRRQWWPWEQRWASCRWFIYPVSGRLFIICYIIYNYIY